jgi:hypothetical protein
MGISIGCTSSDPKAPNRAFWDRLAQRKPADFHFFGPISFWRRVLDSKGVAAAGLTTFERLAARCAALLPKPSIHSADATGIRPFEPRDLPNCLDWVKEQASSAEIHMRWSAPRLDVQLNHAYARTLVLDRGSAGGGFLNYYVIDWSGAAVVKVAVIDLFAGNMGFASQFALLKAAERQMIREGVQLAVGMASKAIPGPPLLASGFAPLPAGLDLFSFFPDPTLRFDPALRYHLLFT